jgi:hypothetical protein
VKNKSNHSRSYRSIALILLAGAARVQPVFMEQIIAVVLGPLVRLRILPRFARELAHRLLEGLTRQRRLIAAGKPRELH